LEQPKIVPQAALSLDPDHGIYRVTARGIKAMWPAIRFRKNDFPIDFQRLASAGC
jgi:hypothetical protein